MKNGTTTLRPAAERSRPVSSAPRHVNLPVAESVADERRGLLIVLLGDGIEAGPTRLQSTLCALRGTSLVELPSLELDSKIDRCDDDLDEEILAISGIIDDHGGCAGFSILLLRAKTFGEYVATVRGSSAWRDAASTRQRLEEHLGDMLDAYLRLWELRADLIGPDRDQWWAVKAPELAPDPLAPVATDSDGSPRAPKAGRENRAFVGIPFALLEAAGDSSPINLQDALRLLVESQMLVYPGHAERAAKIANKIEFALSKIGLGVDLGGLPREAFFAAGRRTGDERQAKGGFVEIGLDLINEAYTQAQEICFELDELTARKFGEISGARAMKAKPTA